MPKIAVFTTFDVVDIFLVFTELQYGQYTITADCCNLLRLAASLSSSSVDEKLLSINTISTSHVGHIVEKLSALLKNCIRLHFGHI
jgi:hypothetical protein